MPKFYGQRESFTIISNTECFVQPKDLEANRASIAKSYGIELATKRDNRQLGFEFDDSPVKGNLVPVPEDFLLFPFRQLSATIVGSRTWKATDFSNEKVLSAATNLLTSVPAYKNHNIYVGEEVGTVGQAKWVPKQGKIPAGIDAPFVIDSVLNKNLCRQMLSPVSPIQCCSVTVIFDWESSHEFEEEWHFYQHVGEIINDEEVRRIVTKIHSFIESSLVWKGADPWARMKDESGEYKIKLSQESVSMSALDREAGREGQKDLAKLYFKERKLFSYENFSASEYNPEYFKSKPLPKPNDEDMFNLALAKKLDIPVDQITEELLASYEFVKKDSYDSLLTLSTEVENLKKEKSDLTASFDALKVEKENLAAEKTALEFDAKNGKEFMDRLRKATTEAYTKTCVKSEPDPVILNEIEQLNSIESLNSRIKLFNGRLMDQFSGHCKDCGSEKIDFRSSEDPGKTDLKPQKVSHLSDKV